MAIRVGLLGLSYGARVHLPAFKNNTRYEVVAVCARTPGRAQAVAREYNVPNWYTDARQLIAAPEVDLVSIATPPLTHAGYAAAALAAGKHVLVEIAFVNTLADARVLADMARQANRTGAAAFVLRYIPQLRLVSDLLAEQAVGTPRLMRFDYFTGFMAAANEWRWMRNAEAGGGVLANFVSHGFDLARQWFGPVAEVDGTLATLGDAAALAAGHLAADDTGLVALHFESGLLAVFNFSAAVAYSRTRIAIHGSYASLLVEGFGDEVALLPMGQTTPRPVYPPAAYLEETRGQSGVEAGFASFLDRLAAAVNGETLPGATLPTFEDALEVSRLIEAVHLAARERRRVRLAEVG